jgi:Tfp pilus assembly protein, pilus retraction ATPase PilT
MNASAPIQHPAGNQGTPTFIYPNKPIRFDREELDRLLLWCCEQDVSDITFQTDRPLYLERHGVLYASTIRDIGHHEVQSITQQIYGENGVAKLKSGGDFDVSYTIKVDRSNMKRFRVNATSIMSGGTDGIQITIRVLPEVPPTVEQIAVEPEIQDNAFPHKGVIYVTGVTGSGKSTLLASLIRKWLEDPRKTGKALEYSAPIEFVYDGVVWVNSCIAQTEIPKQLPNFAAGVRNSLRRHPSLTIVGESRDNETISGGCELASTGHPVFTTAHTSSVSNTVRRLVMTYPAEERASATINLIENMHMIINQTLVPATKGGRVALREFLVFNEEIRREYLKVRPEEWAELTDEFMKTRGRSMVDSAREAHRLGRIEDDVLARYETLELRDVA